MSIWLALWLAAAAPDPYAPLKAGDYDTAIGRFRAAIAASPKAIHLHKDLAYTLLKVGESEQARDAFGEAMRLDPSDTHAALEYAFLANETGQARQARLIFDRIRKTGNPTAEQAFQNIDRPLAEGIARWKEALRIAPDNFSAHEELARLAELRDESGLAAAHYRAAYRLRSAERRLLIDWSRVAGPEEAAAALLAASRSPDARVSETARGLLPARYPYVYEFDRALEMDPHNVELRRELAFLHLEMGNTESAVKEFRAVLRDSSDDPLSRAQLALIESKRLSSRAGTPVTDSRALGERSLSAGYLRDAVKYLTSALEADPGDHALALKLGWAHNILNEDREALPYFNFARHSQDKAVAAEARKAYASLRPEFAPVRTTVWLLPFYSSRWQDAFTYGQLKTEFRLPGLALKPYLSVRFAGDLRGRASAPFPQYLSETAFVPAAGVATPVYKGLMGWGEAGVSISYLNRADQKQRARSDYRGGVSFTRGIGGGERSWFFENHEDGVFISRFGNTFLVYSQNKAGYSLGPSVRAYWNANLTADARAQYWANFAETGPGVRVKVGGVMLSLDLLRGAYTVNAGNPRRPNFFDLRAGVWYAFTK